MIRSRWKVLVFPAVFALSLLFSVMALAQEGGNPAGQAAIELSKTASLDGNCGPSDVITVTWGTRVTFCYTATNTGSLTLTTHTLTDTLLGPILEESPAVLPPGASHWVTATWNAPNSWGPAEHCALWTATDPDGVATQRHGVHPGSDERGAGGRAGGRNGRVWRGLFTVGGGVGQHLGDSLLEACGLQETG